MVKRAEKSTVDRRNSMKKAKKYLQELVKIWNCCRTKDKGTRWERQ